MAHWLMKTLETPARAFWNRLERGMAITSSLHAVAELEALSARYQRRNPELAAAASAAAQTCRRRFP